MEVAHYVNGVGDKDRRGGQVLPGHHLCRGGVACIGLVLWLLISPFVTAGGGTVVDAAIQVAIGSRHIRSGIPVETAETAEIAVLTPKIVDAQGAPRFRTSSWGPQLVSNAQCLVADVIIVAIIYLVRRVRREVAAGAPFGPKSTRRIRLGGLGLVLAGILGPGIEYATARIVPAQMPATDRVLGSGLQFESTTIPAGLLILILVQVCMRGAQFAEDQALTV